MPLLPLSNPVGASAAEAGAGVGDANAVLARRRDKTVREITAYIALSLPGNRRVATRRRAQAAIIRRELNPPGAHRAPGVGSDRGRVRAKARAHGKCRRLLPGGSSSLDSLRQQRRHDFRAKEI